MGNGRTDGELVEELDCCAVMSAVCVGEPSVWLLALRMSVLLASECHETLHVHVDRTWKKTDDAFIPGLGPVPLPRVKNGVARRPDQ